MLRDMHALHERARSYSFSAVTDLRPEARSRLAAPRLHFVGPGFSATTVCLCKPVSYRLSACFLPILRWGQPKRRHVPRSVSADAATAQLTHTILFSGSWSPSGRPTLAQRRGRIFPRCGDTASSYAAAGRAGVWRNSANMGRDCQERWVKSWQWGHQREHGDGVS